MTNVRDVVVVRDTALSEQRARQARGEDDYRGSSDEYRGGAYVGGDAKKRRGVSLPRMTLTPCLTFNRKPHLQAAATVATALKHQSGDEVPMALVHCAMLAACTMRN